MIAERNKKLYSKGQYTWFLIVFIVPTFALFCLLTLYPMVRGVYTSFFDWTGTSSKMTFIGLDNYRKLFDDEIIPRTIQHDYFLVFWKVLLILLFATVFAVALTRLKLRESAFFRAVFFFPNMISVVVIGVLWRFIYNPNLGFLNSFLSLFTEKPVSIAWLGDSDLALAALVPPSVWAGIGFYMVLIMSGIMGISESLYESARIDGAGEWKQFTRLTIPLVWEQIKVSLLSIVMTTLNGSFLIVWLMTEGGPDNSTQVMGSYLYQVGFKQYQMGYATAIGVMILVLSLLTTVLLNRLLRRETHEW
ncbi:carbohydrate ABC transporter permease [Cohnella silvisoli]|uniref:Sugar ABC transporter permease n=1 Tax=Cohnella silvisoli TaxID=2873699 RepID=A0ABV1KS54_9BACL|nr:sugar ABC transporter permease [Cohnella silvisoli]MCD9022418.1 sugar ABC transporter permease [Cohnella silvisoli]